MITLNIWERVQLAKLHYNMGALSKAEFCAVLERLHAEYWDWNAND